MHIDIHTLYIILATINISNHCNDENNLLNRLNLNLSLISTEKLRVHLSECQNKKEEFFGEVRLRESLFSLSAAPISW